MDFAFGGWAGGLIIWNLQFLTRHFGRFGYQIEFSHLLVVGTLFGALSGCGWLLSRHGITIRKQLLFLGLCWLVMSLVWIIPRHNFPLHGDRSDMLPNIVSGIKAWLAGQSPYQWYDVGTHRAPLTYLPMLWFPYIPLVLLKLDPRWIMPLAQLAFLAVLWKAFRRDLSSPWWSYLIWLALNPFVFIRHDLHTYPIWFFVAITLLFMLRQWWLPASIMWGLLLAYRHTLLVPFPFFIVFLYWHVGWRTALRSAVIALVIALLIVGPFFIHSPMSFIDGVINYPRSPGVEMPTASWERVAGWATGFSFVPLLYLAGLSHLIELIQLLVALVMFIIALLRRPNLVGTLQMMSTTFLLILLLNPLSTVYMYAPLLIFVTFTALARQVQKREAILEGTELS